MKKKDQVHPHLWMHYKKMMRRTMTNTSGPRETNRPPLPPELSTSIWLFTILISFLSCLLSTRVKLDLSTAFSAFRLSSNVMASAYAIVSPGVIGSAAAFRLLVQLVVIKMNMNKLNEKGFLLLAPVFDLIMPFVHFELTLLNIRNKRISQWK